MRLRPLWTTALCAAAAAGAVACGDDDEIEVVPRGQPIELRQARLSLEGAGLDLIRDGSTRLGDEVSPEPLTARDFAVRGGDAITILVFADPATARRAESSAAQTETVQEGGSYVLRDNVIAVTARGASETLRRQVRGALDELADAPEATAPGAPLAAADVAQDLDPHLDRQVTVRGDLVRLLPRGAAEPQAMLVGSAGGPFLVVVPEDPAAVPAAVAGPGAGDDTSVVATGVATFVGRRTAGVPDGWADERAGLSPLAGRPALAAATVREAG